MICSSVYLFLTTSPPSILYSSGVLYLPVLLFQGGKVNVRLRCTKRLSVPVRNSADLENEARLPYHWRYAAHHLYYASACY